MNITIRRPLGYSHIGGKDNQEDNVYPLFEKVDISQRFFILCDGVGGQDHGEVASRTVCDTVGEYLQRCYTNAFIEGSYVGVDDINLAIEEAYKALDDIDADKESKMATTFTCVCFTINGVIVAHIGDSRIYQVRPRHGIMYQSADHSLVNALLASGELTPEEAKDFPQKNVITRALQPHSGKHFSPEIHVLHDVKDGDYFFLCCDGVLEKLTNDKLVEILSDNNNDTEKLRLIENESLEKTKDNFTAYLIPIDKVEGSVENIDKEELSVEVEYIHKPQQVNKSQTKKSSKKINKVGLFVIALILLLAIYFFITKY